MKPITRDLIEMGRNLASSERTQNIVCSRVLSREVGTDLSLANFQRKIRPLRFSGRSKPVVATNCLLHVCQWFVSFL